VNVSVGILGHVDSGKTSLARALSTSFSTASLDKNPQSKLRGITLDLGFSSFVDRREVRREGEEEKREIDVCYTLVDCPGHASLIKTVLGGASIIDCMILVVDVNKGIQTQTAECVVVGEIAVKKLIVCLNKIDSIQDEEKRKAKVEQVEKKIRMALSKSKFASLDFVAVSARPGGGNDQDVGSKETEAKPIGLESLVKVLGDRVPKERFEEVLENKATSSGASNFLFAVDHCFAVKGQGTVLTGTVLNGSCKVGDFVEIPHLKEEKKVKSMQIFRESTDKCARGDRVGMCVAGLDPEGLERFLVSTPKTVPTFDRAIVSCEKIRLHKSQVKTKSKFHVTIGHQTVMAKAIFFGEANHSNSSSSSNSAAAAAAALNSETLSGAVGTLSLNNDDNADGKKHEFDSQREYALADELLHVSEVLKKETAATDDDKSNGNAENQNDDEEDEDTANVFAKYCYLEFEKPVTAPENALYIASKLDVPEGANVCRLAFFGKTLSCADATKSPNFAEENLRLFSIKSRKGTIERAESDNRTCVCKGMFKKESDLSSFRNMFVWMDSSAGGARGRIEGSFGKTGKFKVYFEKEIDASNPKTSRKITLRFKRFLYDKSEKRIMDQTGL
jgi:selenocysteine-specific elongation factor